MKSTLKKVISLVLVLIMLFAVAAPAGAATTKNVSDVTIYVQGYGASLYANDGSAIWDGGPTSDILPNLVAVLEDLLKELALGTLTGNYDEYCDLLYEAIAPAYSNVILDKNGEASNDKGINKNMLTAGYNIDYSSKLSTGTIEFCYDWRLSCVENAKILEQFIDKVCREKGYDKVNLLGRCLGGNVVQAYLENAENLDKINKTILYIPSTEGVDFINALFTGDIEITGQALENYVNYTLPRNDDMTSMFGTEGTELIEILSVIIEFLNEVYVLGFGIDVVEAILNAVKDNVLARIVRDTYGGFVGFWNMVYAEDLEDAIAFVYNTPELQEEYAGMIEKIREFKAVQVNARETISTLHEDGMEIMILSKYNFANLPLSANANQHSDSTALTIHTSHGATVANFGETLSSNYINSLSDKRYLSADTIIDASTCVLPDTTWFVKNLVHMNFPASVDKLFVKFLTTDGMTVFTDETYPQYLNYDEETGEISIVEGLDDNDIISTESTIWTKLISFFKFLKVIINFISQYLGNNAATTETSTAAV